MSFIQSSTLHFLRFLFRYFSMVIFLHNMGKDHDPWYGVRGSVVEVITSSSSSTDSDGTEHSDAHTMFNVQFTDLAQVHNPLKNIKKSQGRYYANNVTFIQDIDSPQTVATFLHEIILPSLPSSHRSQALRNKLMLNYLRVP